MVLAGFLRVYRRIRRAGAPDGPGRRWRTRPHPGYLPVLRLGDVIYAEIFARSFFVAGLTTLICILLAYPLAWLIARSPKKRRDLLVLLVILPFASNFLVRVYAWMIILGPQAAFALAVNGLLGAFGLGPVSLLFSPSRCWWAWSMCTCPS